MYLLLLLTTAILLQLTNCYVLIISGEETLSQSNCARLCSGTTGRGTTAWKDYSGPTGVWVDVDMSDCGFTKVPSVTASIEGTSTHWELTGTSSVYNTSPTSFRIYIGANRPNARTSIANKYKWNVDWIATGFTC